MRTSTQLATLLVAALVSTTGCLGLFGGDDDDQPTNATSISPNLGNRTQEEIVARAAGQFRNYTIPGQALLDDVVEWLNGTISAAEGAAGVEDRNDRSGNNYNTEVITTDLTSRVPPGQPAEIRAKLWYFGGPGNAADLDIYVNVPGMQTDFAGDDCDEFSWKVCVQELTINTVGVSGEPMEVGVQVAQGRVTSGMDYFFRVEVNYAESVITPFVPYAVTVPEGASGIVIKSAKAGGAEHVRAEILVISPEDELVEFVTYDDIAIPTESKLIPVPGPGEYVVYAIEMHGGFLSLEADIPVPRDARQVRALERVEESAADASPPAPGLGERCVPDPNGVGCLTNTTTTGGGESTFAVEGTFPLEVLAWIGEGGSTNLMAEAKVLSSSGEVYSLSKFVQHEDDSGTLGISRDELNIQTNWANLAKGQYTIQYVIDGTATVGHTIVTYKR